MGRYVVLFLLVLLAYGCRDRHAGTPAGTSLITATGVLPPKDKITPPKVVDLDTCRPPQVVTVPPGTFTRPAVFSVNMINYSAEQGMYSLINVIKRDRYGNFWLGTGGAGVIRYNGKTSVSFTTAQGLASNAIRSIAEDAAGHFWFGSQGGGVSYYDGHRFTSLTKNDGLSNNGVRSIITDLNGTTWMATLGGGINIYDGKTFRQINRSSGLASDNLNCMIRASDGAVWCGSDSGVSRVTELAATGARRQILNITSANGMPDRRAYCMAQDRRGNIWVGTEGGGLCLLRHTDTGFSVKIYTTEHGLPANNIRGIFEDSRGKLWFCTAGGGVACYDPAIGGQDAPERLNAVPGALTVYTMEHGLNANRVECAGEDATGNLWFGTDGGGLSRFDGAYLKVRIEPKLSAKTSVNCVRADRDGDIWLSSNESGITCYDGVNYRDYTASNILGDGDNGLLCMLQDRQGNYWFGTSGKGLIKADQKPGSGKPAHITFYTTQQGLSANRVYCLVEDTAGRIWAGTNNGISCFDGKHMTTYTTEQGLSSSSAWCALRDSKGNIWFGTFGGGISKFVAAPADGGLPRLMTYSTKSGLASNSVKSIREDGPGNIWVGTGGGGISRFDGTSFLNYTALDGLSNNIVVAVGVDKAGNVWFGTNEGLSVLRGFRSNTVAANNTDSPLMPAACRQSNTDIARGYKPVFEQFNYKNGFPIKDVNTNTVYIDTAGVVWAGTADRLITFDIRKLDKHVEVPHVFIDGLRIGGEKVSWHTVQNCRRLNKDRGVISVADSLAMVNEELLTLDNAATTAQRDSMYERFGDIHYDSVAPYYAVPVNPVLPYKHNSITIDFAATELTRPFLVRYQYMLEGYDEGWGPVTERNSVSYGNIPEGSYTFKLRAQSPDGVWSQPVTYSFKVLPPLYRTWWAYILYAGIFLYVIYLVVHVRTGILKRENARLEAIVAERTAQIEHEKAAVQKQAEELKKLNHFKDKTFSVLSHDLRGPIATSAMVVNLLDDDEMTIDEFKELKSGIIKQLTSTGVLLDNLLKWSKGSMEGSIAVHADRVKVIEIVTQNVALFAENVRQKRITLVQQVPRDTTTVCDTEHLDIVVRNLLANAIKFTPENGTITINAATVGNEMHLSVTDTGVGMTREQLDKLFKPAADNTTYGTAGEKGTGLGLLLSYEFIKANNGRLDVTSEPGNGTKFTIKLPV